MRAALSIHDQQTAPLANAVHPTVCGEMLWSGTRASCRHCSRDATALMLKGGRILRESRHCAGPISRPTVRFPRISLPEQLFVDRWGETRVLRGTEGARITFRRMPMIQTSKTSALIHNWIRSDAARDPDPMNLDHNRHAPVWRLLVQCDRFGTFRNYDDIS